MENRDTKILAEAYSKIQENDTAKRSIFQDVINQFYGYKDISIAKDFIIKFIRDNKEIRPSEKGRILFNIQSIENLEELQKYVTNSMLKFMGHGVIR